jgi:tetratricopeptide (TPR) repeat protein
MSKQLKKLLKQADLYKSQGLLSEARKNYQQIKNLIKNSDSLPNKEKLLIGINKKISMLEKDFNKFHDAPLKPGQSDHVNELIKKLFSFSHEKETDENDASLEGAIALAKFGQFEGAILEFNKLINVDSTRVSAAKNIIRCHIALDTVDEVVEEFKQWGVGDLFAPEQLENVRVFFEDTLDKKGIKKDLSGGTSDHKEAEAPFNEDDVDDEEFLDISAVAITFDSGPKKGEQVELDVSFQSGNIISLIVSDKDESIIENLQVGARLDDLHFYSPIAIFRGAGVVSAKTQIESGPKKGDFSLDIKIESI